MHSGSVDCIDSSIRMDENRYFESLGSPAPMQVQQITSEKFKLCMIITRFLKIPHWKGQFLWSYVMHNRHYFTLSNRYVGLVLLKRKKDRRSGDHYLPCQGALSRPLSSSFGTSSRHRTSALPSPLSTAGAFEVPRNCPFAGSGCGAPNVGQANRLPRVT